MQDSRTPLGVEVRPQLLQTPKLYYTRLQFPSKVTEQTRPSEPLCSWAQGLVEADLAAWVDRETGLLAKANQQSVDLTPQVPVGVEVGQFKGKDGGRGALPCPVLPPPCPSTWAATPLGLCGSPLGTWSPS